MQQPGSIPAGSAIPVASMNLKALRFSPAYALDLIGVLHMLCAAPGLIECTLINGYHDVPWADSLTLLCLQSLPVGKDPYSADIHILKYLSVPALRTLRISHIHTADNISTVRDH
jgi:hypothetical protein